MLKYSIITTIGLYSAVVCSLSLSGQELLKLRVIFCLTTHFFSLTPVIFFSLSLLVVSFSLSVVSFSLSQFVICPT